jgi:putative endonuclease
MSELNLLNLEDTVSSPLNTSLLGQRGETHAAEFLMRRGYRIFCSNFKAPIGRNRRGVSVSGEIDLIGFDEDVLCFIEVKTRSSDDFASPITAVDLRKQRQITRTAKVYRKIFHLENIKFRYDAVAVVIKDAKKPPKIELFKGFWNEKKFRKKSWNDNIW